MLNFDRNTVDFMMEYSPPTLERRLIDGMFGREFIYKGYIWEVNLEEYDFWRCGAIYRRTKLGCKYFDKDTLNTSFPKPELFTEA
jgi:hypothetical protein